MTSLISGYSPSEAHFLVACESIPSLAWWADMQIKCLPSIKQNVPYIQPGASPSSNKSELSQSSTTPLPFSMFFV